MTIKIAFSNIKGGVAKTTSAVAFASELAKKGFRTLLVDMDPQGSASSNLGVRNTDDYSISDVLTEEINIKRVMRKTDFKNLYCIPSNLSLNRVCRSLEQNSHRRSDNRLKNALEEIEHTFDFIVYDTSPYDNILLTNVYVSTEHILVPIILDKNSLEGYEYLVEKANEIRKDFNSSLNILGVLITMCQSNTSLHKVLLEDLQNNEFVSDKLFNSFIRTSVRVRESAFYEKPITEYSKECNPSLDYRLFADEVLERLNVNKKESEKIA